MTIVWKGKLKQRRQQDGNELQKKSSMQGTMIEDFDLLIACCAIANNCILGSENLKHLSRIQGLRLENWIER